MFSGSNFNTSAQAADARTEEDLRYALHVHPSSSINNRDFFSRPEKVGMEEGEEVWPSLIASRTRWTKPTVSSSAFFLGSSNAAAEAHRPPSMKLRALVTSFSNARSVRKSFLQSLESGSKCRHCLTGAMA